jgi:glutathionylspermidine synthase
MSKKEGPKEILLKNKNKLIAVGVAISIPIAYSVFRKFYKTTTEKNFLNISTKEDSIKENTYGLEIISHPNMDLDTIDVNLEMNYLNYHKEKGIQWKNKMVDDRFYKNKVLSMRSNLLRDLVEASFQIHNMCLNAVDKVVNDKELLQKLQIPEHLHEAVVESWRRRDKDLAGKMEFMWNGEGKPKFIRYKVNDLSNIIEASRGQQLIISKFAHIYGVRNFHSFNYIENALGIFWRNYQSGRNFDHIFIVNNSQDIKKFSIASFLKNNLANKKFGNKTEPHSISLKNEEEYINSLNKNQAELKDNNSLFIYVNPPITNTLNSETPLNRDNIIEPCWKLILQSNGLLALLWSMYPDNSYLLPTYFESDEMNRNSMIAKNIYDGSNRSIYQQGYQSLEIKGQKFRFDMWMILGLPVGLGVRLLRGRDEGFISHYYQNGFEEFHLKMNENDKALRSNLYGDDKDNVFYIFDRKSKNFKFNSV